MHTGTQSCKLQGTSASKKGFETGYSRADQNTFRISWFLIELQNN